VSFPTTLQMLQNYLMARSEWINLGQPLRSQERIDEIFNICKVCEHYQKSPLDNTLLTKYIIQNDGMGCAVCGCFINNQKEWNKIAWATTRCPLESPKWVAEENLPPPPPKLPEPEKVAETSPQETPEQPPCGCGR
jgi:hypothetical protein